MLTGDYSKPFKVENTAPRYEKQKEEANNTHAVKLKRQIIPKR